MEDQRELVDAGPHEDDLRGRQQDGQRLHALVVGARDGHPAGGLLLAAAAFGQHRVGGLDPRLQGLGEPRPGLAAEVLGGAGIDPPGRLQGQSGVAAAPRHIGGLPGLHHPHRPRRIRPRRVRGSGLAHPCPQHRVPVDQVHHVTDLTGRDPFGDAEQQGELVDGELRDVRGAVPAVGPGLLGARQQPPRRVVAGGDRVAVVQHRPLTGQQQPPRRGGAFAGDLGDQRVSALLPAHRLDHHHLHATKGRCEHRQFRCQGA